MRPIRLITLAALSVASAAHADGRPLCPAPAPMPRVNAPAPDAPGVTRAAADSATTVGPVTTLEGDVGIRRGERSLGADRVRLDRRSGRAQASGEVVLTAPEYGVRAEQGTMDMDTGALAVDGARYRLPSFPAQGRAAALARDERGVSTLVDGTWSTCPAAAEAWHLGAGRVELDPNTRQGTARHASLWFKGVPLFYAPWFRFPLGDERMSGFLAPRIGRSSDSGAEVSVPWYWNAAPNFDATLTPRWLQRRGTQLQSEWRWLGPLGRWQLNNEYLPDDDLAGEDRVFTRLRQDAAFGAWRTDVDIARASDRDYFDDLGTDLSLSSRTHLRQRADLRWRGEPGRLRLRADSYQTLDRDIVPDNRPYERLPQVTFASDRAWGPLETGLDSELVRFEREPSDPAATRLRLTPAVTWAAEAPGWFARPRLAVDHTSYEIDRAGSVPERIDRTLPIASLDTGVVLDRFGSDYQQTLEPRAFYVYVPHEEQDEIPVFDTGRYGFSFSQLFRERRFTGGDRVGDANRLTLALTSRVLSRATGREILRGSIGGIRHFGDREVMLAGAGGVDAGTRDTSDLIAELAASPAPAWRARASVQWDPDSEVASKRNAALGYRGTGGGVANLGYRFRRDALDREQQEQVDLSFAWPVSPRWQLVARSNYSLLHERNVESLAGVEYDSCCWRFRTVAREYISDSGADTSQGIYFELVLKGLGPVGDEAGGLLERAILGYRDPGASDPGYLDDRRLSE